MVRSTYLPSKNDLFFVSQIFYLNFVIITKNLSTGVYREIVAYTTTSDIGKMWQTGTFDFNNTNEICTIFIVSQNMEKENKQTHIHLL